MRVDKHLWIGEEGEPPPPQIELGFSAVDACDRCGNHGPNAWIYAGWPRDTDRFLELFLCRECLFEILRFTYYKGAGEWSRPEPEPDFLKTSDPKKKRTVSPRQPISTRVRFLVFKRDQYRCQLCGATAPDGAILHIDHKTPVAKGGSNEIDNLWVLCAQCNLGRGTDDF